MAVNMVLRGTTRSDFYISSNSKPIGFRSNNGTAEYQDFEGNWIPFRDGQYARGVREHISQISHGFSVFDAIYHSHTTGWTKARANNAATLATHVVTNVLNADEFMAGQIGIFDTNADITSGATYYLSVTTAGLLTSTKPTITDPSVEILQEVCLAIDGATFLIYPSNPLIGRAIDTPDTTTELITFQIDPVNGVSPTVDTVVHNQAEADAVGLLLYIQDALDILPKDYTSSIRIELLAGTHLPKPDSSGSVGLGYNIYVGSQSPNHKARIFSDDPLDQYSGNIIFIVGTDATIIEPAMAGTSTTNTITRTSGTWTAHQHRGKYAKVTSGAGTDFVGLIQDNTTTTLHIQTKIYDVGSCMFQIQEPNAIISDDGAYECIRLESSSTSIYFYNVKVGTSSTPIQTDIAVHAGYFGFDTCQVHLGGGIYHGVYIQDSAHFQSTNTMFNIQGPYRGIQNSTSLFIDDCYFYGHNANAPFIFSYQAGATYLYRCTLETDTNVGTSLFSIDGGTWALDNCVLLGQNTDIGVLVTRGTSSCDSSTNTSVSNCGAAFDVRDAWSSPGQWTGTGNVIAWKIGKGAKVINADFSTISSTTKQFEIDGDTYTNSDISALGDEVTGKYGSKALRA